MHPERNHETNTNTEIELGKVYNALAKNMEFLFLLIFEQFMLLTIFG